MVLLVVLEVLKDVKLTTLGGRLLQTSETTATRSLETFLRTLSRQRFTTILYG